MEQGPTEQKIIEQCVRQRLPLPHTIANAPEIELGLDLYYLAYSDLTSCRNDGVISWLTIKRYSRENDYSEDQVNDLFFYIGELDKAFLDWRKKKSESERAARQQRRGHGNSG